MILIANKSDLLAHLEADPMVAESRTAYGHDEDWKEVMKELVKEMRRAEDRPAYGSDWSPWLEEHLEECLEEAISIVM